MSNEIRLKYVFPYTTLAYVKLSNDEEQASWNKESRDYWKLRPKWANKWLICFTVQQLQWPPQSSNSG
jgi:hypothetical protein